MLQSCKRNKDCAIVALIIGVGVALSLVVFLWLREHELLHAQEKFNFMLQKYATSIKNSVEGNAHTLNSLAAYHYSSQSITRKEFHDFNRVILSFHPETQALEWIPEVKKEERSRYEEQARAEGLSHFHFTQRNKKGEMITAGGGERLYPVYFVEPAKGNEKSLGFDMGSEPIRRSALEASKRTGAITATAPVHLVQETGGQSGFLLYYPIYHDGITKKEFEGFYVEVFRAGDLIKKAISYVTPKCAGVNMTVSDANATKNALLYAQQSTCDGVSVPNIHYSTTISVAGRHWTVEGTPTETFTHHYITWYPKAMLSLILTLTFFVAWVYYMMSQRYALLSDTNEDLRRFQSIALGRESRIGELKTQLRGLKEQLGSKDV